LVALELTFVGSENLDVSLPNPARGKGRAVFLMRQIPDAIAAGISRALQLTPLGKAREAERSAPPEHRLVDARS